MDFSFQCVPGAGNAARGDSKQVQEPRTEGGGGDESGWNLTE